MQRAVRRHLACSAGRLELIGRYLDKISPALSVHLNIVLSRRGADLRNLTRYDMFLLRGLGGGSLRTTAHELHALLRENMGVAKLLQKSYNSSRDLYSFDDATRRAPLLQLLFRKRRQHRLQVETMKSKKRLLKIPPITTAEARAFLLADDARSADPFLGHIERHLAVVAAEEAAEQAAGLGGEEGEEGGRPRGGGGNPLLLLLQSLSGEDCVRALLDATESFRRANAKRVRKFSGPANSVEAADSKGRPESTVAAGASASASAASGFSSPSPPSSLHAVAASPPSSQHGPGPGSGLFAVELEPNSAASRPGQHSEVSQSRGCVQATGGAIRKARLQSLAVTVDDAEKVLRKLDAISARRPSLPRPSTAGRQRHGSIFESPRKSLSNYVETVGDQTN